MSDTFFNKQPTISDDENMVYTMGGLNGLPTDAPTTQAEQPEAPSYLSRIMPDINFGDFIGSAGQLAQLFPGTQVKPSYQPGLTDLTFTRGYYGPQEDVMPTGFGTESAGTLFWSPQRYQMPAPAFQTQQPREQDDDDERQRRENEAILQTALGMNWSGAYNDYLNRLEAENQDINISNVFTPTNVNYQTQSQWQKQSMGDGDGQYQEQDSDTDTDTSYLDQILERVVGTSISPRVSVRTSTVVGTSITPYTSLISSVTVSSGSRDTDISDLEIFDDTTYGTTTSTIKGGNVNDSINLDDQTIDFDIGKRDPGTVTDTDGDGGLTQVDTAAEEARRKAAEEAERQRKSEEAARREAEARRLAEEEEARRQGEVDQERIRQLAEEAAQRERERIAAEEAERERERQRQAEEAARRAAEEAARRQAEEEARRRAAEEEAARRKTADEQTVKGLYQDLFGRTDVDQEGLDYWTGQLASGKSSTDLLRDLVSGAQGADVQAAQNTDTVSKLYQDLLGRTPDAEGLSYFRQQLSAGATPDDVARNIISGARAGEEASKISQAEYDRYFKQPEDTSTPTPQNAVDEFLNSLTPERLQQIQDSSYEYGQLARELQDEARQYVNGMILTPGITPEQLREGFIKNVIVGRPDLLETLVGQSALDQHTMEYYDGEGSGTRTGTNTRGLADEIAKRATDPDYIRAALSIAGIFGEGSGGDSGSGATAEEAILSGGGSALVTFGRSLLNGEDTDKAIANAATSAAVNAALYFGGPYVQAAYFLDKILAKEFGYDSFVQDGIAYFSRMVEKGAGWVIDKASEIFGDVGDFVGDIGSFLGSIGIDLGGISLAEGGLVDLPSETSYNYADYYGGLSRMPQLSLDEVQPMAFAGGGLIPLVGGGKVARGPGGGLDDLIPTSIDGRRAAALSDGEFVIPADVVSMMGDGSSNAGAKRLYDMVRQVRQVKTGTSKQAGPLPVGKILERTMK